MNTKEFMKHGNMVVPIPAGNQYDLEPGKVYDLNFNRYHETHELTLNGDLNMPGKLYEIANNTKFINRVLNFFDKTKKQTTGVMLYGEKGTGKSLTAKIIAQQSNLPIIVINESCRYGDLNKFFKKFETPVCCIFDEIEKNFDTERLLGFLDGIEKTAKKLVIMTCNDRGKTSKYLDDRCSRVRYAKNYTFENNLELLDCLLKDSSVKEKDALRSFIRNRVAATSVDNIISIIEEIEYFQDTGESIEDIVTNMSITLTQKSSDTESTVPQLGAEDNINTDPDLLELAMQNERNPIEGDNDYDDDYDDYDDDYDDDYYESAA